MTGQLPFDEPVLAEPKAKQKESPRKGRVFLLDGTALAYRGHFALIKNPLTTTRGQNVSALHVFATTLLRILDSESPDYLAVAFDPRGKTFRHEKFEEYKATRDKTPSEMVELLPAIRELVEGFNTPILCVDGYEADDVIATVATQAASAGHEVFIVTGDKDFLQIVSPRIKLYNLLRTEGQIEIQDEQTSIDKFGVRCERVVDMLALMGDSSDNVPGVAGVGKKTAADLIQQFGSIEQIYEHLDDIGKPALKKKLETDRDNAFLSKELVTLDLDAPATFDADAFEYHGPDTERLTTLLREYEMTRLLGRISSDQKSDPAEYRVITASSDLDAMRDDAPDDAPWSVELVVDATLDEPLLGVALAVQPKHAVYVHLADAEPALAEQVLAMLGDADISKRVHDVKAARLALGKQGIDARGFDFDVMIASYCVSPEDYQHDVAALALRYLNHRKQPVEELKGTGRSKRALAEIPAAELGPFACEAADLITRIAEPLQDDMKERGVDGLFRDVETPLARVLERMERAGIAVDLDVLGELSTDYQTKVDSLTTRIYDLAGEEFNINSPKQLGPVLFEKLEIHKGSRKKPRKTKTGYSTDVATLENFQDHPIVAAIQKYRTLVKLKGTYIDALPALVNPATGRIHTSFNQTVAATGRLSSSDPNLQNIPIRTEEGRQIRRAFVPGDQGSVLMSADYSQVELRIMAHLSGDENLRRAFLEGTDVHRWTAGLIFGMPTDEVPPELRGRAKTINFGVMYGMGPQRLAQETGLSTSEATEFIAAYFKTFAGVKSFLDQTLAAARENGYVTTMLGRRRMIPDLESKHPRIQAAAKNVAINTPIQGTAADMIKLAMLRTDARLTEEKRTASMLVQVHDELLLEVPNDEVDDVRELVIESMSGAMELDVPLLVEVGVGANWLEAH